MNGEIKTETLVLDRPKRHKRRFKINFDLHKKNSPDEIILENRRKSRSVLPKVRKD